MAKDEQGPSQPDERIEVFPVCHNNVFYNIITNLDLELAELRRALDWIQQNRIVETQMAEHPEMASICEIELDTATYVCDVQCYEIIIYRRVPR